MSIFNDSNSFRNVGIKNSNNELIVMNINTSTDNLSFHSSTSDNNVDIMNIKTILNKDSNNDLNLSSFDGSSINPVIQINNITQNVNISGNLNITGNISYNNKKISIDWLDIIQASLNFDQFKNKLVSALT